MSYLLAIFAIFAVIVIASLAEAAHEHDDEPSCIAEMRSKRHPYYLPPSNN